MSSFRCKQKIFHSGQKITYGWSNNFKIHVFGDCSLACYF
eukprot:UN10268